MEKKANTKVNKWWASIALLSVEMVVVLLLFFIALFFFIYLIRRVFFLKNNEFDQTVFNSLRPYITETNTDIIQVITFFGSHTFLIPASLLLIAYFLFIRKHRWYSIKIPAIGLSSLALMFSLKYLFGRERPNIPLLHEAAGLSFPSGHSLNAVTFYGLLCYIVWHTVENKVWKWILLAGCVLMILLIGFSRIYLRVHYTSDVIAGYCTGVLWLIISLLILRRMEKYSKKKLAPVVEAPNVPVPKEGL